MPRVAPPGPSATGSEEVVVMLNLQFKPGSEEEVVKQMRPAIKATRAEVGNNEFTFYKVNGRTDEYVILERWLNQAALDSHLDQSYMKAVFALFDEYLAFPMSEIAEHQTFFDDWYPVSPDGSDGASA